MDPELRRYLTAVVALLVALVVATVGLLIVVTDSFLPVVVVGVLTTLVTRGVVEYASGAGGPDEGRDDSNVSSGP